MAINGTGSLSMSIFGGVSHPKSHLVSSKAMIKHKINALNILCWDKLEHLNNGSMFRRGKSF